MAPDPPSFESRADGTSVPADMESSIDLMARAQRGDRLALERLVERYLPRLRRWATGRLPRWAREVVDTDDLVQETLMRTVEQLPRFEAKREGALQAYLRQAVHNKIVDEVRRARLRPGADGTPDERPDRSPSPLEEAIGAETLRRYEAGLARLAPIEREAIIVRVEMGASYEEAAASLGKPSADAARMAVARALVKLAQEMKREG